MQRWQTLRITSAVVQGQNEQSDVARWPSQALSERVAAQAVPLHAVTTNQHES